MDLRSALLRKEAWPGLATGGVEIVETHISWVFLLDRDVFKVKKPVSLGFLDFRTLEARKLACDAEVELNARLAPGVYQGVVAIRRTAEGLGIAGDGEIVDWAVRMVRLSDERRADRRLASGALGAKDIDGLAEALACFHESARCDEHTSSFGTPSAIAVNVRENFAQAAGAVERFLTPEQAAEIERWQLGELEKRTAIFAQRIADRRVRDGHGDLRLEHVYLDPLVVIDCIEFNERFRFADVCSDIAFLAMDLARSGRVDLAERLLARYARASNDFDLYAVVDFYESYRAWVRGKIAVLGAADDEARHYFRLALAAERPLFIPPIVVAVGGIIASGKSTVAETVGDLLGAPVVDADRTRKHMVGVAATRHIADAAWQGAYDPAFTNEVYDEVMRRAEVVVSSGRPVVIDASFRSASMRADARALATRHGMPFRFVECRATPAVCKARLERRASETSVSDGRLEVFDAFCARFEPVTEIAPEEHVVLDTTQPLERTLAELREHLATWPLGFAS